MDKVFRVSLKGSP